MTDTVTLAADDLERFARDLFVAAGLPEEWAASEAEVLIWADLRGVGSHGCFRIPMYLNWMTRGERTGTANIRIVQRAGATAVLDGDKGPGLYIMRQAMKTAVEIAREHVIGWVVVKKTTHTGPMGFYAREAAEQGFIGMTAVASRPLMAYHGTRTPVLGTSPLAIGVPREGAPPIVLDMSSAAIPFGRLAQARQSGTPLPEGVALDSAGRPTTDANAASVSLPLAGPKGAGLGLMIECLTSLLAGYPLTAPSLDGSIEQSDSVQNAMAVAIDPAAFVGAEAYAHEVDRMAKEIAAQPPAEGFEDILMPGERGDREAARRRKEGIALGTKLWEQLRQHAGRLGVSPPKAP